MTPWPLPRRTVCVTEAHPPASFVVLACEVVQGEPSTGTYWLLPPDPMASGVPTAQAESCGLELMSCATRARLEQSFNVAVARFDAARNKLLESVAFCSRAEFLTL